MGGAHVFPGGSVDPADRLLPAAAVCDGVEQAAARIPDVPPEDAVAYAVAAVRELFEEAGVLLARRDDGAFVAIGSGDLDRFRSHRAALASRQTTLRALAEREGLRLALDALTPFAHWVTPDIETKRFDARFFLAPAPAGQEPVHDDREATAATWLDPSAAVDEARRGAIALPPPTWTTLRMLQRFASIDEVLAWARVRRVVPIQPVFARQGSRALLTLPGDPLYPVDSAVEVLPETRFVLENGRWRPVRDRAR